MVVVKYLCKGTGLASVCSPVPISNIPACLLKNVVKQVSQIFYPGKDHMIEKMKEKPTQPQKRKISMDQMKHNLVVLLLLAKSKSNRLPLKYNPQTAYRQIPNNRKNLIVVEVKQLNQNHQIPKLMLKLGAILNFARNSQK